MKYILLILISISLIAISIKPKCEHIYVPVARVGAPSQPVNDGMLVCVRCYGTLIIEQHKNCLPNESWRYSTDSVFLGGSKILIQYK